MSNFLLIISHYCSIIIPQVRVSDISGVMNTDFLEDPFVFPFPSSVNNKSDLPLKSFYLFQNYPNPFNSTTIFQYQLPKLSFVSLKIFNTLGREIKTMVETEKETGNYSIFWDGKDGLGNHVVSGIYLVRFESGDFVDVKKILLIR